MENQFEVIHFEIAKLELNPNDIVILKTNQSLSMAIKENMAESFHKQGITNKIIVMERLDLSILTPQMKDELISKLQTQK